MRNFERTKLLIGEESFIKLTNSHVAVFGVGGVGGYVVEALARSGVSKITVVDNDDISESNINRQILATVKTLGKDKVEVARDRILSINPKASVTCHKVFYLPESADCFNFSDYDYVVDAVDTVSAKIEIITRAVYQGIKVISCMGTGGKLSPEKLKVENLSKTKVCPLARVMRRELGKKGIKDIKVVYSEEEGEKEKREDGKKNIPSMIFVPASAGILIASEVIKDLING